MKKNESKNKRKRAIVAASTQIAATTLDAIISCLVPLAPFQIGGQVRTAYITIKEELFNEKLQAFVSGQKISEEEKDRFLKVLGSDADLFFKRLFSVLDRLDSSEKAAIVGKLFSSLASGKISTDDFLELTSVVENCYVKDIHYFFDFYSQKPIVHRPEPPWRPVNLPLKKLASLGILNHELTRNGTLATDKFELTSIGTKLILHGT